MDAKQVEEEQEQTPSPLSPVHFSAFDIKRQVSHAPLPPDLEELVLRQFAKPFEALRLLGLCRQLTCLHGLPLDSEMPPLAVSAMGRPGPLC